MSLTLPQVEWLILGSALERSKEHEMRCRRRAQAAEQEARAASDSVIKLANQVEALRREVLRGAQ